MGMYRKCVQLIYFFVWMWRWALCPLSVVSSFVLSVANCATARFVTVATRLVRDETEVKCLHAWGKSFCVNSKHKKKKPSQPQQAIQHSMTPRYFSIPGIIAKDLGTGLIPSIFAIFYHRPPLYEEKICPVWVFFCGWNRGNNLSLPNTCSRTTCTTINKHR